jgi:hypothetical protein
MYSCLKYKSEKVSNHDSHNLNILQEWMHKSLLLIKIAMVACRSAIYQSAPSVRSIGNTFRRMPPSAISQSPQTLRALSPANNFRSRRRMSRQPSAASLRTTTDPFVRSHLLPRNCFPTFSSLRLSLCVHSHAHAERLRLTAPVVAAAVEASMTSPDFPAVGAVLGKPTMLVGSGQDDRSRGVHAEGGGAMLSSQVVVLTLLMLLEFWSARCSSSCSASSSSRRASSEVSQSLVTTAIRDEPDLKEAVILRPLGHTSHLRLRCSRSKPST